jgi:hypothetical protein
MKYLLLPIFVAGICGRSGWATTYNCSSQSPANTYTASGDIVLTGSDVVSFVGTSHASPCKIMMGGARIWAKDGSWTGSFIIQHAIVYDMGRPGYDALNINSAGSQVVTIDDVQFMRSSSLAIQSNGSSTFSITNSLLCNTDSILAAALPNHLAVDTPQGQYCVRTSGNSSGATHLIDSNVIRMGVLNNVSGGPSFVTTISNNIAIGYRVGVFSGSGIAHHNYSHVNVDVSPTRSYWTQVANGYCTGGGDAHDNVYRSGHWVVYFAGNCNFHENLVLENTGLDHMQSVAPGANGAQIWGNILGWTYPAPNRWDLNSTCDRGRAMVEHTQSNDSVTFHNNTLWNDGPAGCTPATGYSLPSTGGTLVDGSANAFGSLQQVISRAQGFADSDDIAPNPPYARRAMRMDYNGYSYKSGSPLNYSIGTTDNATECNGLWGSHDVVGNGQNCGNANVDLKFFGVDGSGTMPVGFPWDDTEVLSGAVTVQNILDFYRYVFTPRAGSPLLNGGDPTTYPGYQNTGAIQAGPSLTLTNHAPVVHPGEPFMITGLQFQLSGYVTDDGLPSGAISSSWSVLSQPIGNSITWQRQTSTTANCSTRVTVIQPGTYVLRLTSSDGSLQSTGDITVVVLTARPRSLSAVDVARIQAKYAGNDSDWTNFFTANTGGAGQSASVLAGLQVPSVALQSCSNASPSRCTSGTTLPWTGSSLVQVAFGGLDGQWTKLNDVGWNTHWAKWFDATHFDIYMDSAGTQPFDGTSLGGFTSASKVWVRLGQSGTYFGYDYQGHGWYYALWRLALAYEATGSSTYSTPALALIDELNALAHKGIMAPMAQDATYPSRFYLRGFALAVDCLFSLMTDAEKAQSLETINLLSNYVWIYRGKNGGYNTDAANGDTIVSNYGAGHAASGLMGSMAMAGDTLPIGIGWALQQTQPIEPWMQYSTWLTFWNNQWSTLLGQPQAGDSSPKGAFLSGYPVGDGYNYGPGSVIELLQARNMRANSTGGKDGDTFNTPAVQKFADALLYHTTPNLWGVTHDSDWPNNLAIGVVTRSYPLALGYALQGTNEGQWMTWYQSHMATPPSGVDAGSQPAESQDLLLYRDSSFTATDYSQSQPCWFYGPGDEHYFYRTGNGSGCWDTSATWMGVWGLTYNTATHQARGAGSIVLQRGSDALLVPAGQWANDPTGSHHASIYNFNKLSAYASTLYFADGGTYDINSPSYEGGQNYKGLAYTPPAITPLQSANYMYVLLDLTQAYANYQHPYTSRTLRRWHRGVLNVAGIIVLFDRMLATDASYTKKLRFHLNPANSPSVTSNVATAVVGSSQVQIAPVLPPTATVTVSQVPMAQSDAARGSPFTWIAEVSDGGTPSTTYSGLTVIYSSDSGAAPTYTLLTPSGNWKGVQIERAGTSPTVGLFYDSIIPNGDGYTVQTTGSASFSTSHTGTGKYVVTGLTPGSGYNVTLSGSTVLSNQTVGPDGTLYFTGTSGSYAIGQGCTISPTSAGPWTDGQTINQVFTAIGCSASTFSLAGAWPPGLSGCTSGSGPTCDVVGTIGAPGTYTPTISFDTATDALNITVNTSPLITVSCPLPAGTVNTAYSFTLTASGGTAPLNWDLPAGLLPTGLSLTNSGVLSGNPGVAGTSNVTLRVTDANAVSTTIACSLTINTPVAMMGVVVSGSTAASGGILK